MKIEHVRSYNCHNKVIGSRKRSYCISHIYIDGEYYCDAIEDYDRGLDESWTLTQIKKVKVASQTAIPTGHYKVNMHRHSPKFGASSYAGGYYVKFCNGYVPCLDPVRGYAGILIHKGVNENSSAGCVIIGLNKSVGSVTDSQKMWEGLYNKMKAADAKGETIEWTISRKYTV